MNSPRNHMTARPRSGKSAAKRLAPPAEAKPAVMLAAKKRARKATMLSLTRTEKSAQFLAWYRMDFSDRIHVIRSGVPARSVGELCSIMEMPEEVLMESLGLSRATINRKVQREETLSPQESERVMGMQALIGQVQAMIDINSLPEFDAAKWLATWLIAPLPALGGATPASFMDTVEGQKYVSNLLEIAQSGAYA